MVGDEHQSIYRFRNADLEVFRRERQAARDDPERDVLPLLGNFRSRPAVLGGGQRGRRGAARRLRRADRRSHPGGRARRGRAAAHPRRGRARDARSWDAERDRARPAARAPRRRGSSPRRASSPSACASSSTRATRERGEIVVLLRAFTHVDAYEEALERAGLRPVRGRRARLLDPAAGRGPDRGCSAWSPTRSTTSACSAPSPRSPPGSPRRALAAARAPRAPRAEPRTHIWPVLEWRFGDGAGAGRRRARAGSSRSPPSDASRLERFCAILAGLRAEAAAALARGPGRAHDERLRLRPRPARPPTAGAGGWRTCAS